MSKNKHELIQVAVAANVTIHKNITPQILSQSHVKPRANVINKFQSSVTTTICKNKSLWMFGVTSLGKSNQAE